MAGKRRSGGGFRLPEPRGTLGTLLRTALQQAGGVRDAIERATSEGRSRLDNYRSDRQRQDLLAELGELVLDLIRRGEIDLGELPEAQELVSHLDELDAESPPHEDHRETATPPSRQRFDARRASGGSDGTVGSRQWAPPKPTAPQRVWRPPADDATPPADSHEDRHAAEAPPARRGVPIPTMPSHPHRKGGISFEDDDDLAEYMHPDDVPPKNPSDGDS